MDSVGSVGPAGESAVVQGIHSPACTALALEKYRGCVLPGTLKLL